MTIEPTEPTESRSYKTGSPWMQEARAPRVLIALPCGLGIPVPMFMGLRVAVDAALAAGESREVLGREFPGTPERR
jgi:hypothetical protein